MIKKTYYKTKDYCKVKFSLKADNAKKIVILGINSDWQTPIVMSKKKDGSFSVDVTLPKNSRHQFKYLIDTQEWLNDPTADELTPNEFGGSNSVLIV